MQLVIAQSNFTVGAIQKNCQQILADIEKAPKDSILVFPELALTGYPPEDLLLRPDLYKRLNSALQLIAQASHHKAIVVGHPHQENGFTYNAASVYSDGQLLARYYKQALPNYGVFDEMRYFTAGANATTFNYQGKKIGLLICEDLWDDAPIAHYDAKNVDLIVSLNASPFNLEKQLERESLVKKRALNHAVSIVYVNQVCGQDELVFDGGSFAVNREGELVCRLRQCQEDYLTLNYANDFAPSRIESVADSEEAEIYQALVLATRDYVNKNGFKGAVLGLSGGIDSALTLAVAVDALGPERVQAVMMPFKYTAQMSVEDAKAQAQAMGIEFDIVSIEPMFDGFMQALEPMFAGSAKDTTEENLQARSRGVILMALSNKKGRIVLTTGNKSEMAVGYCTLYGDMAGGFAVIKDVPKTMVYKLANYRNTLGKVIPERVITRPPSAELAPDQVDQDSLPPYDDLDAILEAYVENDLSIADIVSLGYEEAVVRKVVRLVDINEYKRRQSAIGPKVTQRNFGKDRRYPITSGFGREH
ncbi:NAD synthetase [Catenovulum agarivorans DS-2]|uniref:Glutamine-dependent NAD(+) synthetase n=1 Tax=Catenovulum agarivorans DS-2 TaxID=1328313 RepID=W7QWP9_9ALTE|nr:NAD+ synthase [Catenovulum agarivorans]EWH12168.1 NAD synthetase [Catenovulum agarivorans DS-2]